MKNMAPVGADLTQPNTSMEIIRGMDNLQRVDYEIADDGGGTLLLFGAGNWAVLSDTQTLVLATATAVANSFPVWAGNESGRSDVHATGKATILMGGRFTYKTDRYDTVPTYAAGSPITLKVANGEDRVPTLATGADPVLGRVVEPPDATGIITLEVIRN